MDQRGVEDTVFCDVNITTCYNCTCTAKFAHMNGHWKAYDFSKFREIRKLNSRNYGQIPEILIKFPKFWTNSRNFGRIPELFRISPKGLESVNFGFGVEFVSLPAKSIIRS